MENLGKKPRILFLICVAFDAAFCVSCGRVADPAKLESAEAADGAMRAAEAAQNSGDFAKAYEYYTAVALARPANALAHLQTAILAQDVMDDDITAIYHLRAYLRLRPGSDKAALAAERLGNAKKRLSIPNDPVDPDSGNSTPDPDAEIAYMLEVLKQNCIDLIEQLNASRNEKDRLQIDNEILQKKVDMIKDLDETPRPVLLTSEMRQNGDAPVQPTPHFNLRKTLTYQVVPGDTLWSIARNYYRDGERASDIRAANSDKIGDDDSLVPGTILSIPVK